MRGYGDNQGGKLGEDSGVGLADGDSSWGLPHARWPGSLPPDLLFGEHGVVRVSVLGSGQGPLRLGRKH